MKITLSLLKHVVDGMIGDGVAIVDRGLFAR